MLTARDRICGRRVSFFSFAHHAREIALHLKLWTLKSSPELSASARIQVTAVSSPQRILAHLPLAHVFPLLHSPMHLQRS